MTTIMTIKSNSGIEGIVLGADTQLSSIEKGALAQKKTTSKIVYGKRCINVCRNPKNHSNKKEIRARKLNIKCLTILILLKLTV